MKAGEIVLVCFAFVALFLAFALLAFLLVRDRKRQRTRPAAPANVAKTELTMVNSTGDSRKIRNENVYEEIY